MEFDTWLSQKLLELNTDETVFGPYIKSILESEEENDQQKGEDLEGLLAELGDPDLNVEDVRKEIMSRWKEHQDASASAINHGGGGEANKGGAEDKDKDNNSDTSSKKTEDNKVSEQMERFLRLTNEAVEASSSSSKMKGSDMVPDSEVREAILKQYRGSVDGDDDEDHKGSSFDLARNTNAERVLNAQKEMREKAKADSAKKREKDKEDRAKQKKDAEDKKQKAQKKAAKVERKR